jgi:ElaB/YqjD/DUF883 family membrane-anchored ribosome-binding protein
MNARDRGNGRSSADIEQQISQTRREVERTLDAISRKFSPGQMVDEALDYVRHSGGSEFAHNLNETVKRNPMPVTLVGIGLAWLMMSGRERGYAAQSTGSRRMGEAIGGAGHRLSRSVEAGRQKLTETRSRVSEVSHGLRDRMSELSGSTRQQSSQMSQRVRGGYRQLLQEQPFALGALGVALGALLGVVLPPARQEGRIMGQVRDKLEDQARGSVDEQWEISEQVSRTVGETVQREADRPGMESSGNVSEDRRGAASVSPKPAL